MLWYTEVEKTWKMKDFIIITNAKETSTVLSIFSKKVRKRQDSKETKNEA